MRLALVLLVVLAPAASAAELPGFRPSPWFDEQVREQWVGDGIRAVAIAPQSFDAKKPTRLIVFATPNGNTIEQTLGCGKAPGQDYRFDIQHVAAQVRALQAGRPRENVVLVCTEAEGLSWPAWKKKFKDGPARVRKAVETFRGWVPGDTVKLSLAGHSGGGSFLFGYLDSHDALPADLERVVFLDANYSYSDADRHGDKLLAWLTGDAARRLVVVAYDDRKVTYNGKPVVGPDGGTFRATERMRARFAKDTPLTESTAGDFTHAVGLNGRVALHVHTNPKNVILHTALVGEMNGLLRAMTDAKPETPRAYDRWVQPAPAIPARPTDAVGGREFFRRIDTLPLAEREEAIARELCRGNLPDFLRTFVKVTLTAKDAAGKDRTGVMEVMPDYLAVGGDADFVRVPMTPMTAMRVADVFGCALPTRKMVDDIHRAAAVKLEPKPLTKDREAPATFLEHNVLIEQQREGRKLGELVSGVKKDVVVSNRIAEKPNRLALYGWHKADGTAIQPLTIVHWNRYVDYSHGARLVKRAVTVDGKPFDLHHLWHAATTAPLLGDEGPLLFPAY